MRPGARRAAYNGGDVRRTYGDLRYLRCARPRARPRPRPRARRARVGGHRLRAGRHGGPRTGPGGGHPLGAEPAGRTGPDGQPRANDARRAGRDGRVRRLHLGAQRRRHHGAGVRPPAAGGARRARRLDRPSAALCCRRDRRAPLDPRARRHRRARGARVPRHGGRRRER